MHSLRPVGPEERRYVRVIRDHLIRRADREHLEHLAAVSMPEALVEVLWLLHLLRERLDLLQPSRLGGVPGEDEDLEARIGGTEVLNLDGLRVRRADEYLGKYSFPDDQLACAGLVLVSDNGGWLVVHADAAGEESESLERPDVLEVNKWPGIG